MRHRHLIGSSDLLDDALDKVVEDLQLAVERVDELLIRLNPHNQLWQHVVPAEDVDPTALRDIELALQLRPEAFIDLAGKPVFDLSVRLRGLDFQQAVIANEPVRTASDRVMVIGDEADPLNGDVLIEFIPIARPRQSRARIRLLAARRDPELEAVIRFRILRHVMKDRHDGLLP